MTTSPTERRSTLSDAVAEEILSILGRKRMSKAELARRLGVSPMWVGYRLNGQQEIGLNDLELIGDALGVEVATLLPAMMRRTLQTTVPKVRQTEQPTACRPTGQSRSSARPKYAQPARNPQPAASPAVRPYRINDPTSVTEYVTAA